MRTVFAFLVIAALAFGGWWLTTTTGQEGGRPGVPADNSVVIYTAHDDIYSSVILEAFTRETGIPVKAVYDTESNKTVGLVNRLLAERERPACDVFWNNEIVHTIHLARNGVFQEYRPRNAEGIPDIFRSPFWTGFAARARILIINTDMLTPDEYPRTSNALLDRTLRGRCGIAKPLFGTTSTHMAVLFSLNPERARQHVLALKANNIIVEDGNGAVMRSVAAGRLAAGWTDTDDATLAKMRDHQPVDIIVPDQDGSGPAGGVILIPNTVGLIAGAPNPEGGKKLIEFLLRPETEKMLAEMPAAQIPLHPGVKVPHHVLKIDQLKVAPVDWEKAADAREEANRFVQEQFLK